LCVCVCVCEKSSHLLVAEAAGGPTETPQRSLLVHLVSVEAPHLLLCVGGQTLPQDPQTLGRLQPVLIARLVQTEL